MKRPNQIKLRFSSGYEENTPVTLTPRLIKMISTLKDDNMEVSISQTVVRICAIMLNGGKRETSKLPELILEYALKKKLKSRSAAIRNICKEYFEKNPLRNEQSR